MKSWDGKLKQMMSKNKRRNLFYAIYDNEDNYIAGFDKIKEIERCLGLKRGSLNRLCLKNRGEETRTIEDNICMCSQMVHCYATRKITLDNYTTLNEGSKIYSFWEEKIE